MFLRRFADVPYSKSQYETAFNNWGLRKNMNGSDWKFIHHRIEKRKAISIEKGSEVLFNGKLVPAKRVKRMASGRAISNDRL